MTRCRRRSILASLGAVAGSVAGCLAPAGSGSTGADGSQSSTQAPANRLPSRLRLEVVDGLPTDDTVTVYPPVLREWLRQAATQSTPVRGYDETFIEAPDPILARADTVELTGAGDVDGVYDVSVDGGPRYELHVGATPVDEVPADATVTDLVMLSTERRSLVERAMEERFVRVYPETALDEWARTDFFGSYVRHDGTTYRGHEVQQTDAAFFSEEVWYVLSLSAGAHEASSPLTLGLGSIPDAVAERLEPLFSERQRAITSDPISLGAESRAFVEETPYLLTHTRVFELSLVG